MERTRGGAKYYGLLVALCALAFASITLVHWINGRSLIWNPDGIALYYNFFVYEGEWLRGIVSSLLAGSPEVPLYSFEMGYGADILATMGGCLNDPFNLVSAFCPPELAEYLFEALIFVRFVLAALAYSWYSFAKGRGRWATLLGALCYVLCGYVVMWGVLRHPNFLNFAILLPLILWGADRIMARKSPYLFIGGFVFLLLFSLYFSYMMLLITLVYCLLAFFLGDTERSVRRFFGLLGQFALYVLLAALLAGFVAVPMFLVLTSMGRVDLVRDIPDWEPFVFYWRYGANLLGAVVQTRSLVMGVVPLVVVLAFFAARKVMDKRIWRPWAAGLALCFAGSMIPAVGSVFNGFGYVTDRWLIVLGFCAANAATLVLPALRRFRARQWVAFGGLIVLVGAWVALFVVSERTVMSMAAVLGFAVVALMIVALHRVPVKVAGACLSTLAIVGAGATTSLYCSSAGDAYAEQFLAAGRVQEISQTVPFERIEGGVDEAYRVDRAGGYGTRNQTPLAGVKGFDFFSSFYNQKVDDARYDLGISSHWSNYIYNGVGGRFALDNLMGAQYFIVEEATRNAEGKKIKKESRDRAPYGYEKVQDLGKSSDRGPFGLYRSDLALPLAFTYDTACAASAFNQLGMVQRQELLTRACVLPDEAMATTEGVPTDLSTIEQEYEVIEQEGVRLTDEDLEVTEPKGKLVLEAKGVADAENYVVFDRLVFRPYSLAEQRELTGEPVVVNKSDGRTATRRDELKWTEPSRVDLIVKGGGRRVVFRVATSGASTYGGKMNWAVNLGYSEKAVKKFSLHFSAPGLYTWDKLAVVSQPVGAIEENLKKLKESNKASIRFATNRMDVTVAAEEGADERYTFLSVPYSAGWSATVDGQPAEILQANTGFMAVAMDGAPHELVMTYCTPGLKAGAVCTLVGALGVATLVIVRRQWAKRAGRKEQHEQTD